MKDDHWSENISEEDIKSVRTAVNNAKSIAAIEESLYEVSGDFNESPFKKDVEYYTQILDDISVSYSNNEDWNDFWNERLPNVVLNKVKELYDDNSEDDDIIKA